MQLVGCFWLLVVKDKRIHLHSGLVIFCLKIFHLEMFGDSKIFFLQEINSSIKQGLKTVIIRDIRDVINISISNN